MNRRTGFRLNRKQKRKQQTRIVMLMFGVGVPLLSLFYEIFRALIPLAMFFLVWGIIGTPPMEAIPIPNRKRKR